MAELKPLEAAAAKVEDLPLRRIGKPIGRDPLLMTLLQRMRQKQPLVLHGASGIGKTTIAATIAHVHLQQPNESALWLPVDDPPLVELIVRIARAYGALDICNAPNPLNKRAPLAELLRQRQPLIVLDGRIDESVLNPFYETCAPDTPLVIASDRALAGGDWRNQAIGNLEADDALTLFKQKAGLQDQASDDRAASITALLNYEAFPIALAARSMIFSRQTPADCQTALASLLAEHNDQAAIAAIAASFKALSERLRDLLLCLGTTPRGMASISLLRLLSDLPVADIDQSMTILSRLFLVERFARHNEDFYRLHPLVHDYLQDWASSNDRLDASRDNLHSAIRAYLSDSSGGPDALLRLLCEMDNLLAAAGGAAETDDGELVGLLADGLSKVEGLVEAGYAYELRLLEALRDGTLLDFAVSDEDEPAAPKPAAEFAGDDAAEMESPPDDEETELAADDSTFMTIADDELQSVSIDQLRAALRVASQNNETDRQLRILQAIAKVQMKQGRPSEALRTYGETLQIYESSGDKNGALETLDAIAGLLTGPHGPSLSLEGLDLGPALTMAGRHEDKSRALQILDAIGKAQIDREGLNEAIATFNEVLAIHESQEDKGGVLETLDMLSGLLVKTGAAVTALNLIQRGLHLAEERGDPETEMFLRMTLGNAHQALGESVTAIENYQLALSIARGRDDQQNEAEILYKLGLAQLEFGDTRAASQMLATANDMFKDQSKRGMEGQVLRALGELNVKLERWSEAVNYHTSALYIARETENLPREAHQLRLLGKVLIRASRPPEALMRYRQALHVAYQIENAQAIAAVIIELVNLLMIRRQYASIAELLINDGLAYAPDDRELLRLKNETAEAKRTAAEQGITLALVAGTAREYAANAYDYR